MESMGRFSFSLPDGKVDRSGDCKVKVEGDSMRITSATGPLLVSIRDVTAIKASDYRIEIMTDAGTLLLSNLGYRYEDVLRSIHGIRNETMISDILSYESTKRSAVKGTILLNLGRDKQAFEGPGEVRLYETALVVVPQMAQMFKFRYSDIETVTPIDRTLVVTDSRGGKLSLIMLGSEHFPLLKALTDQMSEMKLRAMDLISNVNPGMEMSVMERLSALLREGGAASYADISSVSPQFQAMLDKKLEADLPVSFAALKNQAVWNMARFGFKHGLMGEVTRDYLWFAVPMKGDDAAPGNAIAFEAVGDDSSKATYFYRMMGRKEYAQASASERVSAAAPALDRIVNALREINFRREPVYLSDAALMTDKYRHYYHSVRALPGLKDLRSRFIGRLRHDSPESYSESLGLLLQFNANAKSDEERWTGPGSETEE